MLVSTDCKQQLQQQYHLSYRRVSTSNLVQYISVSLKHSGVKTQEQQAAGKPIFFVSTKQARNKNQETNPQSVLKIQLFQRP